MIPILIIITFILGVGVLTLQGIETKLAAMNVYLKEIAKAKESA